MIDFRIERGWSFDGYQAWILDYRNGKSYIAKPIDLEFIEFNGHGTLPDPTIKIAGSTARELLLAVKKSIAGFTMPMDKEEYEVSKRIEKAMQDHIDSLKLVVNRSLP